MFIKICGKFMYNTSETVVGFMVKDIISSNDSFSILPLTGVIKLTVNLNKCFM